MTGIRLVIAIAWLTAMCAHGFADDATADAGKQAPPPATSPAPTFEPGEISIGEPLQLPFRETESKAAPPPQPATATAPPPAATPSQPSSPPTAPFQFQPAPAPVAAPPQAGTAPPLQSPAASPTAAGTGWLGISVDEAPVPGRLTVVDVAPQSPAALAGVAPNDTLLAINGAPLRNADEMAAALAAISPGMDVKMAVGKGDRIDEVVVRAAPRPRDVPAPDWQASTEPTASPSIPATPPQRATGDAFQPQAVQPHIVPPQAQTQPPAMAPRTVSPQPSPARTTPAPVTLPAPVSRPAIARQSVPSHEMLPSPAPQRSASLPDAVLPPAKGRTALGVRTIPVDSGVQARYRLPEQSGALVIGVVHDLPASKAGVPPGSVIVALGNQPVRDPGELTRLVSNGPVGAPVAIKYVLPGGEPRQAEVTLQSLELPLERALTGDDAAGGVPGILPQTAPTGGEQLARRMVAPANEPASDRAALAAEVRALRQRVEMLERLLERLQPSR